MNSNDLTVHLARNGEVQISLPKVVYEIYVLLSGGFKINIYMYVSTLFGEMIQFDEHIFEKWVETTKLGIDVSTSFDVNVTSHSLKTDNCGHSIWLQYLSTETIGKHGLI